MTGPLVKVLFSFPLEHPHPHQVACLDPPPTNPQPLDLGVRVQGREEEVWADGSSEGRLIQPEESDLCELRVH